MPVTEAELFAAYRVSAGYLAQCGCGGWISAPSTATTKDIGQLIRTHNESTDHQQWWAEQEAVFALQAPRHVCICHGKTT
jgi:hypothetical protein